MTVAEVDEASRTVVNHLQAALDELAKKELHPAAAVQGGIQMCLRLYADILDDDAEAIRQTRVFLDQWEAELSNAEPDSKPH